MVEWARIVIEQAGCLGIAIRMLAENIFPPIPSEVVMPLSAFIAGWGEFHVALVIAVGSVGSLLGTNLWF